MVSKLGGISRCHQEHTLEICALLLSKVCTRILDPCGKGYLYVLRHCLLGSTDAVGLLRLANHGLKLLDPLVALVKALCDVLGEPLDLHLLGSLGLVIVEAREHMRLVQLVEALALCGNLGEQLCDVVRDVRPPRRQQVHLDYSVAIIFECAAREQPAPVFMRKAAARVGVREAALGIFGSLVGMMSVRLPVGDVATGLVLQGQI